MKYSQLLLSTLTLPGICAPMTAQAESLPPVLSVARGTLSAAERQQAYAALTSGVRELAAPGLTGAVATFGPDAFPIVTGKTGKAAQRPVIAAAVAGKTRIVVLGHDGYLGAEALGTLDTAQFMKNAVTWVSGGGKPAGVGVIAQGDGTVKAMESLGFNAVAVTSDNLKDVNTLIVNGHQLKDTDLAALRAFLSRGGGMIIATTGWGWGWGDDEADFANQCVGNQLLEPYGLVNTTGTVSKTTQQGLAVEAPSAFCSAGAAMSALEGSATLSQDEMSQANSAVMDLISGLPDSDTLMRPRIVKFAGNGGAVVPFGRRPVTDATGKDRLSIILETALEKKLPADQIKPNPAGAIFPGDVPPNYKPITKTVSIDTKVPQWHSLGLYAAPGGLITIQLPDGAKPDGLGVRIGCHTDTLYHLDSWKRAPDISRATSLKAGTTSFANPYGGLVYITVPNDAAARKVDVTIGGAYAAPLYMEGQTDMNEWKNTIRWAPGPWAEIATDKIILTVPSRSVRDLDDPAAVCAFYDRGLDAAADLYGIPHERKRPERMVADVQISAGYMHSGYPIMTWLDVEKTTVDLPVLTKFPWGHFHEIGHNHQQSDWTFAGTGEVTNNLLPLYVWTTLLGRPCQTAHPALSDKESAARWAKYQAGGCQFSDWQSSPFLALQMYIQMQQAFGWEPFKKTFAEYRTLTEAQRPKTEEQKHDQWMVRMSRNSGHNLGPFFQKWGIPTSQAARDSVKDLPDWMPDFYANVGKTA